MTQVKVTIYENMETGEYTVSAPGFDDFSTNDEVEARDEAESIMCQAEEAGASVTLDRA